MKILHLATRIGLGGSERNIERTIRDETSQGHVVTIAAGAIDPRFDPGNARHQLVPGLVRNPSVLLDTRALRFLRVHIAEHRYDLVHTHQSKAGILGRFAARHQVPSAVHTVHMPSFGPGYHALASAAFRTLERRAAVHTDYIVTVGDQLRDTYLAAGIGSREQYVTIRSPIALREYLAVRILTRLDRRAARRIFNVTDDRPLVVTAGLLERRKRHSLILDCLAPDLRSGAYTLAIAGAGPEDTRLKAQIKSRGLDDTVAMLGFVDRFPDLLAAADVLVHASISEGVPQVVLQAMAAGLPVVATDGHGLRELLGGVAAICDPAGTTLALAVRAALERDHDTLPPGAFSPWEASSVADAHSALLADIQRIVDDARRKT